jgi:hypothetical protein
VNGLPELWDIDRLAGYLLVSKHFVYRPLLSPGVRRVAAGAVTNWRSGGTRQVGNGPKSFDTAAEADAARQEKLREQSWGGTADPTGRRLLSDWWEKWMATRQVVGSTRARDESIRACQIELVFGKVRLAGPGWAAP